MEDFAIYTQELGKDYDSKKAVSNLKLQVPRESVFALIGPNGAGKTTTVKMLLGFVKPSQGEIYILGSKVEQSAQPNEKITYLGDDPQFYGYLTVEETINLCRPLYERWDQLLAERVLDAFELAKNSKVKALSRGQRAALGLAVALAPKPELLILDEPATQFDPLKKQVFYSLLFQELVGWGGTVFLTTHQLTEVERFADYAAFMDNGKLLTVRSVADLKVSEKRIRVVFQGSQPQDLEQWPGISRIERQGQGFIITASHNLEDIYSKLAKYPHFALELLDMSLEDIFIEYTSKERGKS